MVEWTSINSNMEEVGSGKKLGWGSYLDLPIAAVYSCDNSLRCTAAGAYMERYFKRAENHPFQATSMPTASVAVRG